MTAFYIDPATDDLYISPVGKSRLTANAFEETRQRLQTKLRFFLGEWKLDTRKGLPFFRDFFVKNPNLTVARASIANVITSDPGVANLDDLALTFDAATRNLTVRFSTTLIDGFVLTSAQVLA